jgi:flagella basal body P-ring formation protein FlgA
VRDLAVPKIADLPVSATWDLTPDWQKVRGTFQIPLEVVVPGEKKSIYWVTGKVSIKRKVVVLKRDLIYNAKIQPDDLEIQKRDITFKNDTVTDLKEPIGALTLTQVTAGLPLTRSQFRRPPALIRGQNVTVRMGDGGWDVSIKGVAQESGMIGDLVKVLNPNTKKTVVGTVVAEGLVEVR